MICNTELTPIIAPIARAVTLSGISRSTIYRLAGEGRIRILKIGRTSLVDMASVWAFIETLPEASISAPRAVS